MQLIDQSEIKEKAQEKPSQQSAPSAKVQSPNEIYNRLKYDADLDTSNYVVGFKDDSKGIA